MEERGGSIATQLRSVYHPVGQMPIRGVNGFSQQQKCPTPCIDIRLPIIISSSRRAEGPSSVRLRGSSARTMCNGHMSGQPARKTRRGRPCVRVSDCVSCPCLAHLLSHQAAAGGAWALMRQAGRGGQPHRGASSREMEGGGTLRAGVTLTDAYFQPPPDRPSPNPPDLSTTTRLP